MSAPKYVWVTYCETCGEPILADRRRGTRTECPRCPTGHDEIRQARYKLVTAPGAGLAGGDRFVARDPGVAIDRVSTAPKIALSGWSIADLEFPRAYAGNRLREAQAARRSARRTKELDRVAAAVSFLNLWIKKSRMERTAVETGLTPEESRDPIALLRAARRALVDLTKRYQERVGEYADAEKRVAQAIGDFLVHHADALSSERIK